MRDTAGMVCWSKKFQTGTSLSVGLLEVYWAGSETLAKLNLEGVSSLSGVLSAGQGTT